MPERISDNWVVVISIATASADAGSWNVPGFSSRLYQIARPSRSRYEDLDSVATSIHEQEQVAQRSILIKGGGDQPGGAHQSLCGGRLAGRGGTPGPNRGG